MQQVTANGISINQLTLNHWHRLLGYLGTQAYSHAPSRSEPGINTQSHILSLPHVTGVSRKLARPPDTRASGSKAPGNDIHSHKCGPICWIKQDPVGRQRHSSRGVLIQPPLCARTLHAHAQHPLGYWNVFHYTLYWNGPIGIIEQKHALL